MSKNIKADFQSVTSQLEQFAVPKKAVFLSSFFKTGPDGYSRDDVFIGITVPHQRSVAKRNLTIDLSELEKLLYSKVHEHRLTALFILVYKYQKADSTQRRMIFSFYQKNLDRVNNWDLVDASCYQIVGHFLYHFEPQNKFLYDLAKSEILWSRRIAVVSTFYFIKKGRLEDTLNICEMLLGDKQDLIHKACGWMLREVGKQDYFALKVFLDKHVLKMPRTMLRYAIEKLPEPERLSYLHRK